MDDSESLKTKLSDLFLQNAMLNASTEKMKVERDQLKTTKDKAAEEHASELRNLRESIIEAMEIRSSREREINIAVMDNMRASHQRAILTATFETRAQATLASTFERETKVLRELLEQTTSNHKQELSKARVIVCEATKMTAAAVATSNANAATKLTELEHVVLMKNELIEVMSKEANQKLKIDDLNHQIASSLEVSLIKQACNLKDIDELRKELTEATKSKEVDRRLYETESAVAKSRAAVDAAQIIELKNELDRLKMSIEQPVVEAKQASVPGFHSSEGSDLKNLKPGNSTYSGTQQNHGGSSICLTSPSTVGRKFAMPPFETALSRFDNDSLTRAPICSSPAEIVIPSSLQTSPVLTISPRTADSKDPLFSTTVSHSSKNMDGISLIKMSAKANSSSQLDGITTGNLYQPDLISHGYEQNSTLDYDANEETANVHFASSLRGVEIFAEAAQAKIPSLKKTFRVKTSDPVALLERSRKSHEAGSSPVGSFQEQSLSPVVFSRKIISSVGHVENLPVNIVEHVVTESEAILSAHASEISSLRTASVSIIDSDGSALRPDIVPRQTAPIASFPSKLPSTEPIQAIASPQIVVCPPNMEDCEINQALQELEAHSIGPSNPKLDYVLSSPTSDYFENRRSHVSPVKPFASVEPFATESPSHVFRFCGLRSVDSSIEGVITCPTVFQLTESAMLDHAVQVNRVSVDDSITVVNYDLLELPLTHESSVFSEVLLSNPIFETTDVVEIFDLEEEATNTTVDAMVSTVSLPKKVQSTVHDSNIPKLWAGRQNVPVMSTLFGPANSSINRDSSSKSGKEASNTVLPKFVTADEIPNDGLVVPSDIKLTEFIDFLEEEHDLQLSTWIVKNGVFVYPPVPVINQASLPSLNLAEFKAAAEIRANSLLIDKFQALAVWKKARALGYFPDSSTSILEMKLSTIISDNTGIDFEQAAHPGSAYLMGGLTCLVTAPGNTLIKVTPDVYLAF